jgi:phosphoglycerate kinase
MVFNDSNVEMYQNRIFTNLHHQIKNVPCHHKLNLFTFACSYSKMAKKTVEDLSEDQLKGKKVLVRCDLNVPLDGKKITDDTRIRSSIPTIEYLKSKGAIVTVCSHLGRPKEGPEDKFSLGPCAERMSELLGQTVTLAPDCIGEEVAKIVGAAKKGDVIMLENTRFYKEETKNEPGFVKKLAAPFDLYVNDAFGTAHRAHASTEGVTKFLKPSVSGFLLAKELKYLDGAVNGGATPMAAIVGGSKVSSKITVLEALLDKCDLIIIGGGMVFTFLKAQGLGVGTSLVEDDFVDTAKEVLAKAKKLGKKILLPSDIIVADKFAADADSKCVASDAIPDGWMGLDNGPKTTEEQKEALSECNTIILNGPMGVFEFEKFSKGTFALVNIMADLTKEKGVVTVIGGGDSVAATEQSGRAGDMSHISTGGGASLELLEGKVLPGVAALDEK